MGIVFAIDFYLENIQGDSCEAIFEDVCVFNCIALVCKKTTNGVGWSGGMEISDDDSDSNRS